MYPEGDGVDTAEKLASYFNNISSKYEPLNIAKIPETFERQLPTLNEAEVVKKIK